MQKLHKNLLTATPTITYAKETDRDALRTHYYTYINSHKKKDSINCMNRHDHPLSYSIITVTTDTTASTTALTVATDEAPLPPIGTGM